MKHVKGEQREEIVTHRVVSESPLRASKREHERSLEDTWRTSTTPGRCKGAEMGVQVFSHNDPNPLTLKQSSVTKVKESVSAPQTPSLATLEHRPKWAAA